MGLRTWRNHNFYHLPKAFLPRDKHGKKRPPAVPGPVIFTVNDRMLHAITGSSRLLPAKITGPGLRSNRLRIPFSAKITSKHSVSAKTLPFLQRSLTFVDLTRRSDVMPSTRAVCGARSASAWLCGADRQGQHPRKFSDRTVCYMLKFV